MNSTILVSSAAVGIIFMAIILLLFKRGKRTTTTNNNTVLFFPNTGESYRTLSDTIRSARTSIEVCVYCISSHKLVDILINAHRKGIIVRVITDCEQETISGGQVWRLRQFGIQVRTNNSSYLMHHKFCIVDNSRLVTGSLNWTTQGIECNEENVIVTREIDSVKHFSNQFDKLWDCYDPKNK